MAASYAVPLPSTKQTKTGFLLELGGGGSKRQNYPTEASPPSDKQRPLPSDQHAAGLQGRGGTLLTLFFFSLRLFFSSLQVPRCVRLWGRPPFPLRVRPLAAL